MALKIRLARAGTKKRPFYRMVVAEATAPRDGRFVEKVGTYDPRLISDHESRVVLKAERLQHWLKVGAKPTERVALLLGKAKLTDMPAQPNRPKKAQPKQKAQERMKEAAAKKEEAAAQAKAEAEAKKAAEKEAKEKPADAVKEAPKSADVAKADVTADVKKA